MILFLTLLFLLLLLSTLLSKLDFAYLSPRIRWWTYHLLSTPSPWSARTRLFRFRIPLVLKASGGTKNTEADALKFLNASLQNQTPIPIPIPRLYDSFYLYGFTYALMSKLPGTPLYSSSSSPPDLNTLCTQLHTTMQHIWAIPQPAHLHGQVMVSAHGDGIFSHSFDGFVGPFAESKEEGERRVYAHTDLFPQNILVDERGQLTGIIDWESAGWVPMSMQWGILRGKGRYSNEAYGEAWARIEEQEKRRGRG